ncbi:hypothetical protein BGW80DRAFT_1564805 [Lactifluus volemus]|nr:hypothetical protein BGW80DRAFT_1564805 [Lactifluus volemus]
MQRESHTLSTPPCRYTPAQTTDSETPPHLRSFVHGLSSYEHVPDATAIGPYTSVNHPSFGYPSQYTTNIGYDGPSSQVSGFWEQPQYANQGNHWQSVAHNSPPSGTAQHIFDLPICPSPLRQEYYVPPAHSQDTVNMNTGNHGPPLSNVTPHSQETPGPVFPGISVGEELIELVNRYLQNPDIRRSGKVKVMIVFDVE